MRGGHMSNRIQEVREIYRGKILNVFVETTRLADGKEKDREVVRHPGAAAMVPLLESGEVVLVKQYRHAVDRFLWEIPAGTLEKGESFIACAKRELVEEVGYQAEHLELLNEIFPAPGYTDECIRIFLATGLTPDRQNLDDDEVLEVKPIPFNRALDMIVSRDIQDAKTITGLLLTQAKQTKESG